MKIEPFKVNNLYYFMHGHIAIDLNYAFNLIAKLEERILKLEERCDFNAP